MYRFQEFRAGRRFSRIPACSATHPATTAAASTYPEGVQPVRLIIPPRLGTTKLPPHHRFLNPPPPPARFVECTE